MTARIGIITNSYAGGGAERSALLTAASWPDESHIVLITGIAEGPYRTAVPDHLVTADIGTWPTLGRIVPFGRGLKRIVREHGLTALFANGYGLTHAVLLARFLRMLPRVAVVVVEHNTLSVALVDRFPSAITRRTVIALSRWLYLKADAIIGVSDGVSRDLEKTLRLPQGSVTTIYNPVDIDRIRTAIDETVPPHLEETFTRLPHPRVITTGRLVAQKAHCDLLDAFAALPTDHQGSLVILGEGPLRGELEQQAQRLGIAERVWMPGFVDNPWWFIARSDVFALTSHWEGFGLVLVEAMACGVPVVSTDCPHGPREILSGAANAYLCPVGDPAAAASSIVGLLVECASTGRTSNNLSQYEPSAIVLQHRDTVLSTMRDADST